MTAASDNPQITSSPTARERRVVSRSLVRAATGADAPAGAAWLTSWTRGGENSRIPAFD